MEAKPPHLDSKSRHFILLPNTPNFFPALLSGIETAAHLDTLSILGD